MKKFIGVLVLLIGTQSCQQEVDVANTNYIQIGIDHNDALERMFLDLKAKKSTELSLLSALDITSQSAFDIFHEKYPDASVDQLEHSIGWVNDLILPVISPATGALSGDELFGAMMDEARNVLSVQQYAYLERITSVMNAEVSDLDNILSSMDQLEAEVRAEVDIDEQHELLTAIYIGRASAEYWNDNLVD